MKNNKASNEEGIKDFLPSFRSVGSIPYDFNRLKYTTAYRASLSRYSKTNQSLPKKSQFKIELQQQKTEPQKESLLNVKKSQGIVDKWKQKYRQAEEENYFERRKSYDCLPEIRRQFVDGKDKFRITKYISPPKKSTPNLKGTQEFKKVSESDLKREKGAQEPLKSARELMKEYSITLNQKPVLKVKKKKSRSNNIALGIGEEIPARWDILEEEEWIE